MASLKTALTEPLRATPTARSSGSTEITVGMLAEPVSSTVVSPLPSLLASLPGVLPSASDDVSAPSSLAEAPPVEEAPLVSPQPAASTHIKKAGVDRSALEDIDIAAT